MTKEQANEIKKIVKSIGNFTVYFNSKKGELRYTVAEWYEGHGYSGSETNHEERERKNIVKILNALSENGMRPKYRKDFKRYQGFINCSYIVFE